MACEEGSWKHWKRGDGSGERREMEVRKKEGANVKVREVEGRKEGLEVW